MRISHTLVAGVLLSSALIFGACGAPAPSDENAQFPAGKEIMAVYKDGPTWMDATVTYVTAAEEYDVQYTNGEEAKKLPVTSITTRLDESWATVKPEDKIVVPVDGVWTSVVARGYNGNEIYYTMADGTEGSVLQPNVKLPASPRGAEATE